MKVLFRNTTKYNKENCKEFINFHNNKYGKKELTKLIFITLIILYMIIFNIIYKNWILFLVVIAVGGVIYLVKKYQTKRKAKKKNKVKVFTFYFYEKYFKIKYKRKFERLLYFQIHKVFETEKYFFLYLNEKSSLILNKDGFDIGTAEEFSKFIKSKVLFKYSNEIKIE